jgi:elongation factor P--(R)-beta-lysine ligase
MRRKMSRDEFLTTEWAPYPQPLPSHWGAKDWCFGKIAQKHGDTLHFVGRTQSFEIRSQLTEPTLGAAVGSDVLRVGDIVACNQSTGAAYLLSPNLASDGANTTASRDATVAWQTFLETVRRYFIQQGFRYWQTPSLLPSPGIDAHIDFFSAQGVRTQRSYFLPTSPEFALKKALAEGQEKIFEIKSCFRDDDNSPTHKPEFFMLEWYRAYADKWELFEDFLNLVRFVVQEMKLQQPAGFVASRISMDDLFLQKIDFPLGSDTSEGELRKLLEKKKLHTSPNDDWDDLFFRLYIEFIEPSLGFGGPQAVYNFPFSQGSLSRKTEDGWADRFEIYWQGMELANAYQEQTDPAQMKTRYQSEREKRERAQKSPHPQDPEFFAKMQEGFPPCAGIALGLDRLWMVLNL